MKKMLWKIKDVVEILFYTVVSIFFVLFLPIWLLYKGQILAFSILYLPILLFIIIGSFSLLKEKKYKRKNVTENIIVDEKLGQLTVTEDSFQNTVRLSNIKDLFPPYEFLILFEIYNEDSKNTYFDTLRYVMEKQTEIKQSLKGLFLSIYEKEQVEEKFKISSITSENYVAFLEYYDDISKYNLPVTGEEDLKRVIQTSRETDFFLVVHAECNDTEFALAYINCRTKEIGYCLDELD